MERDIRVNFEGNPVQGGSDVFVTARLRTGPGAGPKDGATALPAGANIALRPVSEYDTSCYGDGGHEGGERRQSMLALPTLTSPAGMCSIHRWTMGAKV